MKMHCPTLKNGLSKTVEVPHFRFDEFIKFDKFCNMLLVGKTSQVVFIGDDR